RILARLTDAPSTRSRRRVSGAHIGPEGRPRPAQGIGRRRGIMQGCSGAPRIFPAISRRVSGTWYALQLWMRILAPLLVAATLFGARPALSAETIFPGSVARPNNKGDQVIFYYDV